MGLWWGTLEHLQMATDEGPREDSRWCSRPSYARELWICRDISPPNSGFHASPKPWEKLPRANEGREGGDKGKGKLRLGCAHLCDPVIVHIPRWVAIVSKSEGSNV